MQFLEIIVYFCTIVHCQYVTYRNNLNYYFSSPLRLIPLLTDQCQRYIHDRKHFQLSICTSGGVRRVVLTTCDATAHMLQEAQLRENAWTPGRARNYDVMKNFSPCFLYFLIEGSLKCCIFND